LKSSALETPLPVHKTSVEAKAFECNRKEALELAFTLSEYLSGRWHWWAMSLEYIFCTTSTLGVYIGWMSLWDLGCP
jgi:hypothetical protein